MNQPPDTPLQRKDAPPEDNSIPEGITPLEDEPAQGRTIPEVEENITEPDDDTFLTYDEPEDSPSQSPNPLVLGLTIALVFILGLALGFLGRPVLIEDLPIEVVVTVVPGDTEAVAQANSPTQPASEPAENSASTTGQTNPQNEVDGSQSAAAGAPTPTIMDFVLSDARHIEGSDEAEITIVEFSDFN